VHHENRAGGEELNGEVTVGHGVHGIIGGLPEAQGRSGLDAIHRVSGGGKGSGPQGALVHSLQTVLQSGYVTPEHVGIGHHIVAEGSRLGPLEVGIAGHDGLQIGLCLFDQYLLQIQDLPDDDRDLLLHIEPEIHRHLVISAAGGMQALARVADAGGKHRLDIHVDILILQ